MALQYVTLNSDGAPAGVLDTVQLSGGQLVYQTGAAKALFEPYRLAWGWTPADCITQFTGWSNGYKATITVPDPQ